MAAQTRPRVANKPGFEPATWGTVPETHLQAWYTGFCDAVCCHFETAFGGWAGCDAKRASRGPVRGTSPGICGAALCLRATETYKDQRAHTTAFVHQVQHFVFLFRSHPEHFIRLGNLCSKEMYKNRVYSLFLTTTSAPCSFISFGNQYQPSFRKKTKIN